MPTAVSYQTTFQIIISNFQSTDFPIVVAVYTTDPSTPAAVVTANTNGTYSPQNSSGGYTFPGTGWYLTTITASNLGGTNPGPVAMETVVLEKNSQAPPVVPTASRHIRVIVRNFPIDGGNGDEEDGNQDDQGDDSGPRLASSL